MNKKKSPAFQFYPADWLSSPSVAMMTPEQEGAYIRLLCYCWMKGSLPDDDVKLAALSRLGEQKWNECSTLVKQNFTKRSNVLINERLEKEREKQIEWSERNRQAGIASGKARREKRSRDERVLNETPTQDLNECSTSVEQKANSSSSSSSSSNTSAQTHRKCVRAATIPYSDLVEKEIGKVLEDTAFIKTQKDAYPQINVLEEIRKAKAWLIANEKRSKKKDFKRFVGNWLTKAADRARPAGAPVKQEWKEEIKF